MINKPTLKSLVFVGSLSIICNVIQAGVAVVEKDSIGAMGFFMLSFIGIIATTMLGLIARASDE